MNARLALACCIAVLMLALPKSATAAEPAVSGGLGASLHAPVAAVAPQVTTLPTATAVPSPPANVAAPPAPVYETAPPAPCASSTFTVRLWGGCGSHHSARRRH